MNIYIVPTLCLINIVLNIEDTAVRKEEPLEALLVWKIFYEKYKYTFSNIISNLSY